MLRYWTRARVGVSMFWMRAEPGMAEHTANRNRSDLSAPGSRALRGETATVIVTAAQAVKQSLSGCKKSGASGNRPIAIGRSTPS